MEPRQACKSGELQCPQGPPPCSTLHVLSPERIPEVLVCKPGLLLLKGRCHVGLLLGLCHFLCLRLWLLRLKLVQEPTKKVLVLFFQSKADGVSKTRIHNIHVLCHAHLLGLPHLIAKGCTDHCHLGTRTDALGICITGFIHSLDIPC